jgi:signal transduction histidine kinase
MRAIINNLRPTVLDLGLNAAIEWQVKEFQRRTGIACELVMPEAEVIIDDSRATALFRILQESLNNVFRHARATRAKIELNKSGERLLMMVADNGVGIFPGCRRKANSFGLVGIKERISTLGGELSIDTAPDSGTALTISVPLPAIDGNGVLKSIDAESSTPVLMDRRASDAIKKGAVAPKRPVTPRRGKALPLDTQHD